MIIRLVKCILLDEYINSKWKTKKIAVIVEDIKEICYNICTDFNYGEIAIIKITNTEDCFMSKITVKDTEINITKINDEEYINNCLG